MFNLLEELSTEAQEFLVGGQAQGPQMPQIPGQQEQGQPGGPPKPPQKSGGATGYIVPDNNPENYFTWKLDKAPQTQGQ
ncbi:MAG: hypothetical protein EAZ77_00275 [Nostocales cyanobacterium]|nr:MAG: hypothetical protein EAZ77_00275 [Nostocales cyanobacterium]